MKQIFAIENNEQLHSLQQTGNRLFQKLEEYKLILQKDFELTTVPKGVLWTTGELATTVFSNIPLPAFTNRELIIMSPNLAEWRELFLRQLEGRKLPAIETFYKEFSENQLFIILAHELTHHIDLFLDEFDEREDSIWFEEGMCFYLPRKLLLTEKEFKEISDTEWKLVNEFADKYGEHSIDQFGSASYRESLTSIMYDYWRSYLIVKYLVEVTADGNISTIFNQYQKWHMEGCLIPLSEYFKIDSRILKNVPHNN